MPLILILVFVCPIFQVIFIIQHLKSVRSLVTEDVEGTVIGSQPWTHAKQYVVSNYKTTVINVHWLTPSVISGIDVCTLQPEPDICRGSFPRYFYNIITMKCERFIYGGCGGNGNRFSDIRSCEEACVSSG